MRAGPAGKLIFDGDWIAQDSTRIFQIIGSALAPTVENQRSKSTDSRDG
jgi:hypothetical protein